MLAQSRVIAKGKRIRDVGRLAETYGGTSPRWVKRSSPRFELARRYYEYYWYEHPTTHMWSSGLRLTITIC